MLILTLKFGTIGLGFNVHPEMAAFEPGQGRCDFATTSVAMATLRIARERERRPWLKDAVYGWAFSS